MVLEALTSSRSPSRLRSPSSPSGTQRRLVGEVRSREEARRSTPDRALAARSGLLEYAGKTVSGEHLPHPAALDKKLELTYTQGCAPSRARSPSATRWGRANNLTTIGQVLRLGRDRGQGAGAQHLLAATGCDVTHRATTSGARASRSSRGGASRRKIFNSSTLCRARTRALAADAPRAGQGRLLPPHRLAQKTTGREAEYGQRHPLRARHVGVDGRGGEDGEGARRAPLRRPQFARRRPLQRHLVRGRGAPDGGRAHPGRRAGPRARRRVRAGAEGDRRDEHQRRAPGRRPPVRRGRRRPKILVFRRTGSPRSVETRPSASSRTRARSVREGVRIFTFARYDVTRCCSTNSRPRTAARPPTSSRARHRGQSLRLLRQGQLPVLTDLSSPGRRRGRPHLPARSAGPVSAHAGDAHRPLPHPSDLRTCGCASRARPPVQAKSFAYENLRFPTDGGERLSLRASVPRARRC